MKRGNKIRTWWFEVKEPPGSYFFQKAYALTFTLEHSFASELAFKAHVIGFNHSELAQTNRNLDSHSFSCLLVGKTSKIWHFADSLAFRPAGMGQQQDKE